MSTYYSMPFGMVSAVYAWDRLAESLNWIFGYFLHLPLTRYVDDMFTPIYGKHAMEVRNALLEVSGLLGIMLDEAKTPAPASCESLLGVSISVDEKVRHGSLRRSISIRLDPVKAEFWENMIREALRTKSLSAQAAKKLAGRLNFAVSAAVGGTGGARLKEIYRHSFGFTAYTESLHDELTWWLQRLQSTKPSLCPVGPNPERTCIVYSDAEGNGGLGGILRTGSKIWWFGTTCEVARLSLKERKTQIIPIEALAAYLTLLVFKSEIGGSRMLFLIDKVSALGALRKGRSKSPDIHRLATNQ